jgi:O-antigen/teichoic acid export membrane protein
MAMMKELSRTQNSIRNTTYGISTQILIVAFSFITRTVFIKYLSVEYLGINGLFTNILTVLSLAELGFGGAMVYSMYEPLASRDYNKLSGLMNFYSEIYKLIGFAVCFLGLILVPFLMIIIKDSTIINDLTLIYLLFLMNSVASYFFAYKRSILQANQMQYIISRNYIFFNTLKSVIQIITLILFKNYLLFLVIQLSTTILENIYISKKVSLIFPYLRENINVELDYEEKKIIWSNVKALMIYKIGSTVLDGTDNIIISSFVGIVSVGYLSNYILIVGSITMILQQISNSIIGSIGNYVATENNENQESLLHKLVFIYFIIFGFSFVALFMLLNPFITLWLGKEFTLPVFTVFVITFNWYITGIMNPVWTFRATKGLFIYGRFRPAISAVMNIIVSILLAMRWGLIGVLLGTTITRLSTNSWYDPYVIFKYGFNKSPSKYYKKQVIYFGSLLFPIITLSFIFRYFANESLLGFLTQIILLTAITLLFFVMFFKRTDEFKYFEATFTKIMLNQRMRNN